VGEGRKSLALQLEFRAADRTLTDAEVAERRQAITEAIAGIGGSLRE
jgi:phenylalanyl-tRNA synthetase beta chain